MDKNQAIEEFVLSKTAVQMVEATLEENSVEKLCSTDTAVELHNDLNFSYKVNDILENEIEAFMKTTIIASKNDGMSVIKLEVTYRGKFTTDSTIDDEDFRKFVEIQTVPQLLPYARTFISSLTAHMGIEPIVLPTMDIIQSLIENSSSDYEEEQ